jgi:tetratricopeptide (TPR) repeat protein
MSSKQYDKAIESYDQAIALDPTNAIYYSNRAAAYSSKGEHLSAVGDAEQAITVDPKFVKAYHRLGYAYIMQWIPVSLLTVFLVMPNILWQTSGPQRTRSNVV